MRETPPASIVHLELRTWNLGRACALYADLFAWELESVRLGEGSYRTLNLGAGVQGGIVERENPDPSWLPYVEVGDVHATTRAAREAGAGVLLGPCEGPAGWRSILAVPAGAEVALWQPKR